MGGAAAAVLYLSAFVFVDRVKEEPRLQTEGILARVCQRRKEKAEREREERCCRTKQMSLDVQSTPGEQAATIPPHQAKETTSTNAEEKKITTLLPTTEVVVANTSLQAEEGDCMIRH